MLVTFCSSCLTTKDTNAPSSTVETVPTTSTTVLQNLDVAKKAWESWITTFEYVDSSQISKSECGVFAILIIPGGVTFHSWDGATWSDISAQVITVLGEKPAKIYTQDFTKDGILDFFVTFEDQKKSGGSTYGGFFAFPWSGEKRCQWEWVDINDGRGLSKTVESPEVNMRRGVVLATGYESGKWKSSGEILYSSSSGSFVFQKKMG